MILEFCIATLIHPSLPDPKQVQKASETTQEQLLVIDQDPPELLNPNKALFVDGKGIVTVTVIGDPEPETFTKAAQYCVLVGATSHK